MAFEFVLAVYLIAVGLAVAGMGTYFYQGISGQVAALRFDGATVLVMFAHLLMSFVCGPFIILRMGLTPNEDGQTVSLSMVALAALIAFGWAFITGLLFVGIYFAVFS